ncbi:MAG: N-acetyltransferase [Bacteroidales bacterium]|nr:MAG: N-acetyltransferase [Bacteroidales bacterium]
MQYDKLTDSDIDKISHLQPEGWSDIIDAFRFYCNHNFCNPIKVTLDNEIVGVGSSMFFDKTAWLAHIIVNPDYRKHGIGSKIVDSLLMSIKTRKIETSLLIATEIGEPVYVKAGFRKVSDYRYFKRESCHIDKQFSDNIQPYEDDFYNDIIQLDAYISGENREKLLKNYLNKSSVFISNKVIDGFYIPGLGEGPIMALTINAAKELMRHKYSTVDKATIPSENQVGIELIKEFGFIETNTIGKRMILGKDIEWKPEMIYSRIGGNFG